MERYEVHPVNPNQRFVLKAVESLKNGELISYPTDVNYGIGCMLSSVQGVRTLNALTERLGRNRLHTIICRDISDISQYARVSNDAFKTMKRVMPGPYTFILEATQLVPKICQTRRKTIGIRMVDHPVVEALISRLDSPLLNFTALHLNEQELIESPALIEDIYSNSISILLDVGPVPARHTTVIDFSSGEAVVVREGAGSITNL